MNANDLVATANALVAGDKGLLAMDESNPTCNQRFAVLGIAQTAEMRRQWRDLIVSAPGLGESISGAILFDETIRQRTEGGRPFAHALLDAGILPGIKADTGAKDLAGHAGEKVTEGLDGLWDRLAQYVLMGARFAKWRGVMAIGDGIPSASCIAANAQVLARFAALCQEAGLVPIVEPEVLMEGNHGIDHCARVTEEVLRAVFTEMHVQGVLLEGLVLKPAMVVAGVACTHQAGVQAVADATLRCLLRGVPAAVGGVAFLSGGQSGALAAERLCAMNLRAGAHVPWALTFSFARAIQHPALDLWAGQETNRTVAQQALVHRAACSRAARRGEYRAAMERQ